GAEASLPEIVANQSDTRRSRAALFRCEGPTEKWFNPDRMKEIGGDRNATHTLRVAMLSHVSGLRCESRYLLETPRSFAPSRDVGICRREFAGHPRIAAPKHRDARRLAVRQRAQHHRVHHTENRRIRANA